MKHPALYRFLLTLACAVACVYTHFALSSARNGDALISLAGCFGLLLTAPLVKRVRSAYAKRVWVPTLLTLVSATVSFDTGWRWPFTHSVRQLPALFTGAVWWATVIAHAWISLGILVAGTWLMFALLRWWRLEQRSGHSSFLNMLSHSAGRVAPGYARAGRAALIGAGPGLLAGLVVGFACTYLPTAWLNLPHIGDALRLVAGGTFGFWIATRQASDAAYLRLLAHKQKTLRVAPLSQGITNRAARVAQR